ncbi:MAG: hypothetical protein FWC16_01485 [Defluviitaleaceae bacterium]|nr:hypothetical protein [Defluviitaleaceae bacterium]MCL2273577.1 hypothetical protein [Defluviitaleaceae bacterium]
MLFLPRHMKRGMTREQANEIIEKSKGEPPLDLEKGDIKAMIMAAIIVFAPVVLIFGGSLWFVYWFIFNVWAR